MKEKRGSFTGQLGFIMAAAGSAVGLGNIWRFPYLAAKDGGGLFLVCYLVLAVTFGFTLLTTEIAIGRKTQKASLAAYGEIHPKWGFLGKLASLVPVIILPYYCTIGGWIFKYLFIYLTGQGSSAKESSYFTGYITSTAEPLIWMFVFFLATAIVVYLGVDKGIEKCSRIFMPILVVMIVAISVYSLTLTHTDENGVLHTGLQGLKVYLIPNLDGISVKQFFMVVMDAMGQLFFSISVAMGIMVTYGSYVNKETNLLTSINQIEIFDTAIAFLAGMMIIPSVITFMGEEGMSSGGPGLIFISLPKVFDAMGTIGYILAPVFFIIVSFAAVTSSVSVMETVVASIIDVTPLNRKKSVFLVSIYTLLVGVIVCLGYNVLYFEVPLPTGGTGQVLDILDYLSNNILMPLVALCTSILIGWVVKPRVVIDEVKGTQYKFGREKLYVVMIKFVVPIMLILLFLQALGIVRL